MDYDVMLDIARRRRSIRLFKRAPVSDADIEKVLEVGRWAMSGGNGQPWEFVVVRDAPVKAKIAKIIHERTSHSYEFELTRFPEYRQPGAHEDGARNQAKLVNSASAVIVVCGDPRTFQASVLGNQFLDGEWDIFHMNVGNAAMMICLAAASLGLGTAWLTTTYPPREFELKELLDIPREFKIYVIIPIGYPDYVPPPSYRRGLKEITHWGKYDQARYRTDRDIREWLINLRKKTHTSYHLDEIKPAKKKPA
jgi:nitroreductase